MCDRRIRDLKRSLTTIAELFGATVEIEPNSGQPSPSRFQIECCQHLDSDGVLAERLAGAA